MYNTWSCLAVLTLTFAFAGCNAKSRQDVSEESQKSSFSQVDDILAKADSLAGKTVSVEGVCTHICKHGGGKIFLMGSDDTRIIRIEAGEKIGSFKPETVNSIVQVSGILVEDRIDENYLSEWEQKLKDNTQENHASGATSGCSTEKAARQETHANSAQERIDNFRTRIAERQSKEGKNYLSFYHIDGSEYAIQ